MTVVERINYLQERIARHDDQFAYKQLFLLFAKPLENFSSSILGNYELAQEIVSDVFLRVWEQRSKLESIANLRVYLYVATRNSSLTALAKEKKSATLDIDDVNVQPPLDHLDPEKLFVTREMLQRLRAAINQLPPQCRLVFKLVREDGLRYKEVAEVLGISAKTVENQMSIAIRKLAQAIPFDVLKSVPSAGNSWIR
jgi:RNA polymerase sigma-70 factor (family 1)